jgi:dihydroneopterin aldolase
MDKIFLTDLRIDAVIGIFDWERCIRQTVSIDLEMAADIRAAAARDDIEATLNYKAVAKRVIEFVKQSEYGLIETLAEQVARIVVVEFGVAWTRVTLHKPGAVRGSRDVGIVIERRTGDFDD